jgi:phage recombination protein Bet
MDTQLQQIALAERMQTKVLALWEDSKSLADIRKAYAKNATDTEFNMLIEMGRATALNPFLREIWLVKYGNGAAQIFIGRDGYRIAAQRQPDYDYHLVDAVYSNDKFQMWNGEVQHQYEIANRGSLIGAYCVVKRKSATRTMYVFVEFPEYDLKQGLWKTKPATMIKKVAEAQAIRMAFQSTFAGTYAEEELPENKTKILEDRPEKQTGYVYDSVSMINPDQVAKIDDLMMLGDISYERLQSGMRLYFKKAELQDLTEQEASELIERLEKKVQNEITKEKDIDMEVTATDEQTKQGADSEEIRATGDTAHNNNN